MKKLLLATSILAGTAGFAAAEITFSGDARMGFIDDFVYPTNEDGEFDPAGTAGDDDIGFTSRARIGFTFSGETDGGLSFGASFRADNSSNAAKGTAGSVFLSGAFGKISMGDVDGAAVAAVGHVDGVGLTGLSDLNESAFLGNGGLANEDLTDLESLGSEVGLTGDPSVLYEYTTGNIGLFVSVTNPGYEADINFGDAAVESDGVAWAIGANYTTDAYMFGIGYEDIDVDDRTSGSLGNLSGDHLYLGADATFGAFTGKIRWGTADLSLTDTAGDATDVDFEQVSLSGTYTMDAISVTGFYADKDFDLSSDGSNLLKRESIGIGASYDLGGGASIVGGIVDSDITDGDNGKVSDTAFDFGVSFSF